MNAASQAQERLKPEKRWPAGPPHSETEVGIPAAFGDLELLPLRAEENGRVKCWGRWKWRGWWHGELKTGSAVRALLRRW